MLVRTPDYNELQQQITHNVKIQRLAIKCTLVSFLCNGWYWGSASWQRTGGTYTVKNTKYSQCDQTCGDCISVQCFGVSFYLRHQEVHATSDAAAPGICWHSILVGSPTPFSSVLCQ